MRKFLLLITGLLAGTVAYSQFPTWQAPVIAEDTWRYLEPTSQPALTWNEVGFNDSAWPTGQAGFGYGDGDDNTTVAAQVCVYLRIEFNVNDPSAISDALFYIDYDDGYVAYLNGTEIGRSNTMNNAGVDPPYDEATNGEHEAQMYQGGSPEEVEVDPTLFQSGTNCLAIQAHNWSATSSDMSAIPFLFTRITDGSSNYPNPPTWFVPPIEEFETHLPLIMLDSDGQTIPDNMMIDAQMSIINNGPGQLNATDDVPTDFNGRIGIEVRGSSSQQFPKKQYEIETRDLGGASWDVSILGMPEESDWILYAPYSDKSMLRNILTYDLSNAMGQYAPRSQFCEVFLNDVYIGVYVLMEKIKWGNDRVDIIQIDENDTEGNDLTGGYLLKVDKETGSGVEADWWSDITFYEIAREYGFQYERPLRTLITAEQETYIQEYVNDMEATMESTSAGDPATGYRHYFDLPAMVNYTLLTEFTRNIDGYRLSTFFSKQRDSRGGKLIMGPIWDMNIAYGNADYCDGDNTEGWAYLNCERDEIPFWWDVLFDDDDFRHLMSCRWQELRQGPFHEDSLMAQIDDYVDNIGAAAGRNYLRWPILGTWVWPNAFVGNTYEEEVQYLKDYVSGRLEWMDQNVAAPTGDCAPLFDPLLVSEISYNQDVINESGDWFELYNGSSATIDLSYGTVKDNSNYNSFTFPAGSEILADSFLVVARDLDEFMAEYPDVENVVQGSFKFGLSTAGDDIRIWDVDGLPIANLTYGVHLPWPTGANGGGHTLEFDLNETDQNDPANWFEGCVKGSPGTRYTDCSLSIREQSSISFSVLPTIGAGEFTVYLGLKEAQLLTVQIMDLQGRQLGQVINAKGYQAGAHRIPISVSDLGLEYGFYLIRIMDENGRSAVKRIGVIK